MIRCVSEGGKTYEAIIYKDGEDTHWNDNPTSIEIEELTIDKSTKSMFKLAPDEGLAISLKIK